MSPVDISRVSLYCALQEIPKSQFAQEKYNLYSIHIYLLFIFPIYILSIRPYTFRNKYSLQNANLIVTFPITIIFSWASRSLVY